MLPSWMPAHLFRAYFVGCALFAAATSLTVRKFVRLSSTLLGSMLFLFVCMMPIPNALADPKNRLAWAYPLRRSLFAGGAWALAGPHSRASSPQRSKWMILLGRIVIAIAAIFFAVEFFLHPEFAPAWPTNDRPHSIPISAYLDPRRGGTTPAIMQAINYVFDTWLYAGTALVLASALPRDPDHVEKT